MNTLDGNIIHEVITTGDGESGLAYLGLTFFIAVISEVTRWKEGGGSEGDENEGLAEMSTNRTYHVDTSYRLRKILSSLNSSNVLP